MKKVHVLWDGQQYDIQVQEGQTILETLLANEVETPYSCEGGYCGTCKAKITDGTVTMEDPTALDEEELEDQWILTCQAIPTSDCTIEIQD